MIQIIVAIFTLCYGLFCIFNAFRMNGKSTGTITHYEYASGQDSGDITSITVEYKDENQNVHKKRFTLVYKKKVKPNPTVYYIKSNPEKASIFNPVFQLGGGIAFIIFSVFFTIVFLL